MFFICLKWLNAIGCWPNVDRYLESQRNQHERISLKSHWDGSFDGNFLVRTAWESQVEIGIWTRSSETGLERGNSQKELCTCRVLIWSFFHKISMILKTFESNQNGLKNRNKLLEDWILVANQMEKFKTPLTEPCDGNRKQIKISL